MCLVACVTWWHALHRFYMPAVDGIRSQSLAIIVALRSDSDTSRKARKCAAMLPFFPVKSGADKVACLAGCRRHAAQADRIWR